MGDYELTRFVVDHIGVGVFAVDKDRRIVLWNGFMESNTGVSANDAHGKVLFELFPSLPKAWLNKKIESVFRLKNFSFTSWEQRPYLFMFEHNRPVTGGIECMRQNSTFMPVKSKIGDVEFVCITIMDVTDASIYQKMLADSSNRDGLTGVYNRKYLDGCLLREFKRAQRYSGELSILMFDLDHFKSVNDTFGHLAGDKVIQYAAEKASDGTRDCDVVGRYGGEEFIVILPETGLAGALRAAERLRASIEGDTVQFEGQNISVTASVGVSSYSKELDSYQRLLANADAALYQCKGRGRNRVFAIR